MMFKELSSFCQLYKNEMPYPSEDEKKLAEIRRLYILENAITNYAGGIETLQRRVNTQLTSGKWVCLSPSENTEMESLLRDLNSYLRDVSKHLQNNKLSSL